MSAGPAPGPSYPTEYAYFEGDTYLWQFPTQKSNDRQELIIECWNAGILPENRQVEPTVDLYAIFMPGATLHSCPGQPTVELHDHLLSAVPGTPRYSTHWHLWDVDPGPNFDPDHSPMPITTMAQLRAAEAAGQVVIIDDEIDFQATVLGRAQ